jgi:hypothetical protein
LIPRELFEKALSAEGIPLTPSRSTPLVPKTELFRKKIGYGATHCPFSCPHRANEIDYEAQRFPVAEAVDKEVFWLTDALPILRRKELNDIIAAVEKVATTFLARASRSVQ